MQVNTRTIKIVSRQSNLALQQANIVRTKLLGLYPDITIEIIGITTKGDQILDQSLTKIGGKGLFVKELEHYLLDGKADIAVHSMKDVPSRLPEGLALGAILTRADVRDVLVSIENYTIAQLPAGAIVGTSSLRRQSQLLAVRDDLRVADLRGNIETRLKKLETGQYQAIILAAAGLERLQLNTWLQQPLATNIMLPAAGQGALGIEYRSADLNIKQLIQPLNDAATAACVTAERAMNAQLDGGCQAPVGGLATIENNILTLRGLVGTTDGKIIYTAEQSGPVKNADQLGIQVAIRLQQQGADKIIQSLKCLWSGGGE